MLFQKGEGKCLVSPKEQGSAGLIVRVFPLERDKIDVIYGVMVTCLYINHTSYFGLFLRRFYILIDLSVRRRPDVVIPKDLSNEG